MKGGPFKSSETRFPHSEAIGSVRRCINFVVIYFKTMYNKTIIRFGFCNIRNNQQSLGIDCEKSLAFLCKVTARET